MAWAAVDIGLLPGGNFSIALAASSDGSVIVGVADSNGFGDGHAFWWTDASGMVDLGVLAGGTQSIAHGVSADGQWVVGYSDGGSAPPGNTVAVLWHVTAAGATVVATELGFLATGQNSAGWGISDDGLVAVGSATVIAGDPLSLPTHPFRWTTGGGMVDLGLTGTNTDGIGQAASTTGTVVAGGSGNPADVPWYWDGSLHAIPLAVGQDTGAALAISDTGSEATGYSRAPADNPTHAFIWTGGTTTLLGEPGFDDQSIGYGMSGDGTIVVGQSGTYPAFTAAFYWTDADGFVDLPPLDGDGAAGATGISADGLIPVGFSGSGGSQHAVFWALTSVLPVGHCGEVHTSDSFTAAWTYGATADTYTVDWRKVGDVDFTEVTGITDLFLLITGLESSTTYEFKVDAILGAVHSGFSELVQCSTLGAGSSLMGSAPLCGWRGLSGINWHGMALVGDKFSNVIGLSDFSIFTEYGNGMRFLITSPPIHEDRKRIFVPRFEIEVEAGLGLPTSPETGPIMVLDVSKDGGKTWQPLQKFRSMGAVGEYRKRLRWLSLGNARQWVFRLSYSDAARPALIGCYLDIHKGLG